MPYVTNIYQQKPILIDPSQIPQSTLRDDQYDVLIRMLSVDRGLIQLPTGYGKTYLYCYATKFLPKPLMIWVPTNVLIDEVKSRFNSMNLSTTDIHIINPISITATNDFKDGNYDSLLSSIKTLIMDEAQSFPNSYQQLYSKMTNLERAFGFSATPDKRLAQFLTNSKIRSTDELELLLPIFGRSIASSKLTNKVSTYITDLHLGSNNIKLSTNPNRDKEEFMKLYSRSLLTIFSKKNYSTIEDYLLKMINHSLSDPNSNHTIFIPYFSHKHIIWVLNSYKLKKYKIAVWNKSGLYFNDLTSYPESKAYPLIKTLISSNRLNILFGSSISYKGIDIPELQRVCFFIASSYGLFTQILGRAARNNNNITVYLPHNIDNNEVYNSTYNSRYKQLLKLTNNTFYNL